ncbi:MAG: hypothetical protein ABL934_08835 [Lysobacteraceae bacterium]
MTTSDFIGTIGVSILLIAFVLNQRRTISEHSRAFLAMNLIGALMCGYSAWLVHFMPFVVLENVWALVAAWGLLHWSPERQN